MIRNTLSGLCLAAAALLGACATTRFQRVPQTIEQLGLPGFQAQ